MASSSLTDDIANRCGQVSLEDDSDEGFVLDDEDFVDENKDLSLCLIGKVVSNRSFNTAAFKATMAEVWQPGKGIEIQELAPKLFSFQFFHSIDMNMVLNEGPWSFEQKLLVMRKMEIGLQPENIELFEVAFWVQCHNLPIGFWTERIGRNIGNQLGSFISVDSRSLDGNWKAFMRIRVLLDIRKPLKISMKVKKQGGEWVVINFKYERLPHFCFLCGVIGHQEKFCEKRFETDLNNHVSEYGSFLRAPVRKTIPYAGERWFRANMTQNLGQRDSENHGANHGQTAKSNIRQESGSNHVSRVLATSDSKQNTNMALIAENLRKGRDLCIQDGIKNVIGKENNILCSRLTRGKEVQELEDPQNVCILAADNKRRRSNLTCSDTPPTFSSRELQDQGAGDSLMLEAGPGVQACLQP